MSLRRISLHVRGEYDVHQYRVLDEVQLLERFRKAAVPFLSYMHLHDDYREHHYVRYNEEYREGVRTMSQLRRLGAALWFQFVARCVRVMEMRATATATATAPPLPLPGTFLHQQRITIELLRDEFGDREADSRAFYEQFVREVLRLDPAPVPVSGDWNKSTVGRVQWLFLHLASIVVRDHAQLTDEFAKLMGHFMVMIPCIVCAQNYRDLQPLQSVTLPIMGTRDPVTRIYELHNIVNGHSTPRQNHFPFDAFLKLYELEVVASKRVPLHVDHELMV